jgi:hypothetical protein
MLDAHLRGNQGERYKNRIEDTAQVDHARRSLTCKGLSSMCSAPGRRERVSVRLVLELIVALS